MSECPPVNRKKMRNFRAEALSSSLHLFLPSGPPHIPANSIKKSSSTSILPPSLPPFPFFFMCVFFHPSLPFPPHHPSRPFPSTSSSGSLLRRWTLSHLSTGPAPPLGSPPTIRRGDSRYRSDRTAVRCQPSGLSKQGNGWRGQTGRWPGAKKAPDKREERAFLGRRP